MEKSLTCTCINFIKTIFCILCGHVAGTGQYCTSQNNAALSQGYTLRSVRNIRTLDFKYEVSANVDHFPCLIAEVLKNHYFPLPCRNDWDLLNDSGSTYSVLR